MNYQKIFTVDYFIRKFSTIPERMWHTGSYVNWSNMNQKCAFGHCDALDNNGTNAESIALNELFVKNFGVAPYVINDGHNEDGRFFGENPKIRILKALYAIKETELFEKKEQQQTPDKIIQSALCPAAS